MDDLRNDWLSGTKEDQWIYKTRATIGSRLVIPFMIFLYTAGTSLRALTPFLREKIVLQDNTTLKPVPGPGYFFFNEHISPNYEIICFVQVFCGFINYTALSGTLGLCTTLCLHMCSILRILGNNMNDFTNLSKMDETTAQKKIRGYCSVSHKIQREWEDSNTAGYTLHCKQQLLSTSSEIVTLVSFSSMSATNFLDSETCNKGNSQVSPSVQTTAQRMTQVQNAEEGIRHILQVVYPLLNALGAWPTNVRSSVLWKVRKYIQIVLVYLIQLGVMTPALLYISLFVKDTSIRIKLIMPHLTHFCQLCKYTIVLWRHNEIRELLDDLKNDWLSAAEDDQWIYKSRATIEHRLMISIIIFLFTGGALFLTITPFLREKVVLPDNTTIRPLPSPSYFVFFNDQVSPNYEIIFFIEVFCGFINYTTYTGALALCTTLCLHMCSMLKILGNKMRELSNLSGTDEDTVQNEIANIVVYQTKIRKFFNRAEHVTSFIYFVGITSEVIIMCIVGYIMIMEWESSNTTALVTYFALELTTIIGMFTNCFVGQLLIDEGNIVKKISNTFDWYQLPVKKARSLILIIITSNIPMTITVANMVQLSLITFIDIMKATVGYFNVLRSTI